MTIIPSHTAVLVPSVTKAAKFLSQYNFKIAEPDDFPETLEIYVGYGHGNSLLLMQPNGPGSYQRALDKRGPGVHHLAIDVENLESYLISLVGSGWFIHPSSIEMMKASRTAYLARPGFPGLIEVQEVKELKASPLFVEKIDLQMDAALSNLLKPIGLDSIVTPTAAKTQLTIAGKKIKFEDLL